ncbi:imelysin family protein [Mesorhizobium sp. ORM8.1]
MKLRYPIAASLVALSVAPAFAAVSPLDLVQPIADYKIYVQGKIDTLVKDTKVFTDAVKAGDLAKAKALYAPARVNYETIEPIAELFSDLDGAIDSRADDHEQKEKSADFYGFHRIE